MQKGVPRCTRHIRDSRLSNRNLDTRYHVSHASRRRWSVPSTYTKLPLSNQTYPILTPTLYPPDIIELGIPFTDPLTDGPTIQKSNAQALQNGVRIPEMLQMVREARKRGLTAPVVFMGYYNPVRAYGEEKMLRDCRSAGVNGFIMVDLPPEEAVRFRGVCKGFG